MSRSAIATFASVLFFGSIVCGPLLAQAADGGGNAAPEKVAGTKENEKRSILQEIRKEGDVQFRYGEALYQGGYLERAYRVFQDFLVLHPDHPEAFQAEIRMAMIDRRLDRNRSAVDNYVKAYRREHESERGGSAYLEAGKILAELGDEKRATEILSEIIARRPYSRLSRLATLELNSMRFLDVYSSGRDRVEINGNGGTAGSLPSDTEPGAQKSTVPGAAGMEKSAPSGGETLSNDALNRMGEGVEEREPAFAAH